MTLSSPAIDAPAAFRAAREAAFVARLPGIAFLDVQGADAQAFLQGQLSSDVAALAPGRAQWSTYNSPKGRMLATPLLWRVPGREGYRAAVAADLADALRKRLAMFVLRSRVSLAPAPLAAIGVGGPHGREAVSKALAVDAAPGTAMATDGGEVVALADGRILLAVDPERADRILAALAPHATPADESAWRWLGIRAGVAEVRRATQELHVAQTANWEVVGGVSFSKGCFPGQEIVARVQHLGILKERAHPFHADAPAPEPTTRLYRAGSEGEACGSVVDAVALPGGGSECLAVVQLAALEDGDLRLGAPDGPALERLPLPYALPKSAPKRVKL
ncbi:MAG TPA: folate-binding protein [Casimicrobiaceae bacterium]|nr:folate-binding protein [Casimicrobiaceae bacterium]